MLRVSPGAWALVVVACAGIAPSARAQGVAGGALWTAAIANANVPSAPATDISFNLTSPTVYLSQSTRLYAFDARGANNGAQRWMKDYSPTLVQNYPSPVPLKGGQNVIFFGGSDGRLYAVKSSDGSSFWPGGPIDLRRSTCTTEDKIVATPAIQLWNYSNATYKSANTDDLIFVPTRYGCSTSGANRVYAIKASTGAIAWTFNIDGSYALDYASSGCAIDYTANQIYCGFNQPSGTTQNSLYALSTATASATGSRVWAVNAGPIQTSPQPRGTKIYVGTANGWLRARNVSNGSEAWSVQVTSAFSILKNPWPEPRLNSQFGSWIFVIDSGGNLSAWEDSSGVGTRRWTQANYNATSMTASAPFMQRLYVGKSNGTVHELDYTTGTEKASFNVGSATGTIYDPSLGDEAHANGRDPDRLYIASGAQLAAYSIPWVPCTWNASTSSYDCAPASGTGGGANGTCIPPTVLHDACGSGTSASCNSPGTYNMTCGGANSCCATPANKVCTNELMDDSNCGGCGLACPSGQSCSNGSCFTCAVSCSGTSPQCTTTGTCQCTNYPSNSCASLGNHFVCNGSGNCQCIPNCNGATCGSDGCGGSCGTCSGSTPFCTAWNNAPPACYCQSTGAPNYAPTDSCTTTMGPTWSCGFAPYDYTTSCICTPNCTGKNCGSDGCGGSCGTCSGVNSCAGGGTAGVCGCTPSCNGVACGGSDGCGGVCSSGSCSGGYNTCGGGGTANVCGCTPRYCEPDNAIECRSANTSDGCGGTCVKNCTLACHGACCGSIRTCGL